MRTLEISGLDGEAPGDIVGAIAGEAGVEAGVVARVARAAVEAGLDPGEVAVVTPYDDQRDRLRRALAPEDLEVDTVDGVQGREKEVVLVSFVRNPDDELGFLTDLRRPNVAPARPAEARACGGRGHAGLPPGVRRPARRCPRARPRTRPRVGQDQTWKSRK
jgi:hypothetical protein